MKAPLDKLVMDVCERYFGIKPYLVGAHARQNYPEIFKEISLIQHREISKMAHTSSL